MIGCPSRASAAVASAPSILPPAASPRMASRPPASPASTSILSLTGAIAAARRSSASTARPGAPAGEAEAGERASILVVDDSITTRTLEKSILEAQGYRVLLAVDGVEALNLLRGGEAVIDLVLADVEMPRMDGFGLLQAIKNDPRLAGLPVILMTSRADEADIRRGLELGAGAYLTKQKFDQRELLATIGQLL